MASLNEVLGLAADLAGGGAAGFLDTKFADRKVLGMTPGQALGVGLVGFALTPFAKGKAKTYALEVGGGALSYEVGKLAADRTAKAMSSSSSTTQGSTAGVGALPRGSRVVSQAELQQSLDLIRRMQPAA